MHAYTHRRQSTCRSSHCDLLYYNILYDTIRSTILYDTVCCVTRLDYTILYYRPAPAGARAPRLALEAPGGPPSGAASWSSVRHIYT